MAGVLELFRRGLAAVDTDEPAYVSEDEVPFEDPEGAEGDNSELEVLYPGLVSEEEIAAHEAETRL